MPWRAVWPGAPFVTVTAGLANWLFPIYLSNVSSLSRFGSTLGFILIALLWFYVLSLALMAGAVINSLRYELHDTGELPTRMAPGAKDGCADCGGTASVLSELAEPWRWVNPVRIAAPSTSECKSGLISEPVDEAPVDVSLSRDSGASSKI